MTEAGQHRAEHRRRHPVPRLAASLIAASGTIGIGGGIGIGYAIFGGSGESTPSHLAIGEAECADGQAIVGVWVDAGPKKSSGSGWASLEPDNSAMTTDTYTLFIDQTAYTVHVGCGGTTENWATANYGTSEASTDKKAGWQCAVPQGVSPEHGTCEQIGIAALQVTG